MNARAKKDAGRLADSLGGRENLVEALKLDLARLKHPIAAGPWSADDGETA